MDLRKEQAIKENFERKKKDRKWFNVLRNQPKWSATDLAEYRIACEIYAAKMAAFKNGLIVKGKGKKRIVKVVPHPPEPSFKAIYKAVKAGTLTA